MLQCEERSLLNGHVNCTNDSFYKSSCFFECNKGYKLNENVENICVVDENGVLNWDNELPICNSKLFFFAFKKAFSYMNYINILVL